jgi:hypothetical protein
MVQHLQMMLLQPRLSLAGGTKMARLDSKMSEFGGSSYSAMRAVWGPEQGTAEESVQNRESVE